MTELHQDDLEAREVQRWQKLDEAIANWEAEHSEPYQQGMKALQNLDKALDKMEQREKRSKLQHLWQIGLVSVINWVAAYLILL